MSTSKEKSAYITHAENATGLLRESVAVHNAEMAGEISTDVALPIALSLNEQAAHETDLALAAAEADRIAE